MLQSSERLTSPHIYRNKLTIINNKITFLEQEINRTKPRLQKAPKVQRSQSAAPKPVTPVTVSQKVKVSPEPRKGYFLAYSSTLAKFLTPNKAGDRNPPEQALLPLTVEPIAKSELPERHVAQEGTVVEKVSPVSRLQLPPREVAAKAEQLIVIKPTEPEVRKYFPTSGQMPVPGSMDILKQPLQDKAKVRTAKTGQDWRSMSNAEKEIYVLSVMGSLSRRDVFLMKSYDFYIKSVDRSIADDPALETEYVHKIIMTNAYASEPESRRDLERVWR